MVLVKYDLEENFERLLNFLEKFSISIPQVSLPKDLSGNFFVWKLHQALFRGFEGEVLLVFFTEIYFFYNKII